MQKIISILGVVSSVLFATAPQFTSLQPKTAAWLTLLGTVATAASGALAKFGASNIYITVTGVCIAILSVLGGAGDLIPENLTFVLTVAGTAIAAFGKSLFNIDKGDDDSNTINPRFSGWVLILGLGAMVATSTACDKSKEFVKTLDRVSGYVGTGLDLTENQVRAGKLDKDPALAITTALITINEINGQLIVEAKKYVSPDGKTLTLDAAGKTKLLTIVKSSQDVAIGLLANPTFTALPTETRNKYIKLIQEITATIDIVGELIQTVQVKEGI